MAQPHPDPSFALRHVMPRMRYLLGLGRVLYARWVGLRTRFGRRPASSPALPDRYSVHNTSTRDGQHPLEVLAGRLPPELNGSLYLCQCLGSPGAFMVGDTNIVKIQFADGAAQLTNRLSWSPATLSRWALKDTRHRFDFFGLMYLSPGLGMVTYTEGMYLLPDGRIAVTSDVDRPWVIDREELRTRTPIGRREEWLPFMAPPADKMMGTLFGGHNNSHVVHTDPETKEVFLVSYQIEQPDGRHPVHIKRWDGAGDFEDWQVLDEAGESVLIEQSIHELVCSRDFILLADTAFVAGMGMLTPWVNAPLPMDQTVVWVVDRRELFPDTTTVTARRIVVEQPCIHLLAAHENPDDRITLYMLHTRATNTAEMLQAGDRDLKGQLFPPHMEGYGTLPVLDLSSMGKHVLDVPSGEVVESSYIEEQPYTWGPYIYMYPGRQLRPFQEQDLFVLWKGFDTDLLPKRIFEAYKDVDDRRVPIEQLVGGEGLHHNPSITRVDTAEWRICDAYVFPDRVLCYTISSLEANHAEHSGWVIAAVVTDEPASQRSSGHEYWLFEAEDLARGPIARLGHPQLNNATLFHSVYLPAEVEARLPPPERPYQVDLRADHPPEEVAQWGEPLDSVFRDVVWPYFDQFESAEADERAAVLDAARRASSQAEPVLGEQRVGTGGDFADRMLSEARESWTSANWRKVSHRRGVLVESKPVAGSFASSGVLHTRSVGVIEASADATFAMLTSPQGYAVIDPVSDPADHERPPLESYDWRPGTRLEAAVAFAKMPGLPECEFVVLNAIDPAQRLFVSKSILHDAAPGGSRYSEEQEPPEGRVRALNTFAISTEPLGPDRCTLRILNYADMVAVPSGVMNLINTRWFLQAMHRRIQKAMR